MPASHRSIGSLAGTLSRSGHADLQQVELDRSSAEVSRSDHSAVRSGTADRCEVRSVHFAGQRDQLDLHAVSALAPDDSAAVENLVRGEDLVAVDGHT